MHTHSWCMVLGNLLRKLIPVTVMVRVTNIKEKRAGKKKITHKESHYSLSIEINPVPWTLTYTINHNTASSWNYSNHPHWSLVNYFLSTGPLYSFPAGILNQFGLYTKTSEKAPTFSSTKFFLPKVMILEYIPLSHPGRATCKYRREDSMRVRSHRCTVFGSFGDSRKPDEEQWWSPGNPARSAHTYSGWKARPVPGGWNSKPI